MNVRFLNKENQVVSVLCNVSIKFCRDNNDTTGHSLRLTITGGDLNHTFTVIESNNLTYHVGDDLTLKLDENTYIQSIKSWTSNKTIKLTDIQGI